MAISLVRCPECNAGLKSTSPAGFVEGQTLTCPKCQTMFGVEAPAKPQPRKAAVVVEDDEEEDVRPRKKRPRREEDDEDDRPRKKKKTRQDDEGFRYTRSPVRIVVISVLLVILAVLGVLLYQKIQRERDENKSTRAVPTSSEPV
ncbi:MAG TPA: hypothetical protein VGJ05_06910 [Fimbriiglobus sp.]